MKIKAYKNHETIVNFDLVDNSSNIVIEDADIHFYEEISDVDEMKKKIKELFNEDAL